MHENFSLDEQISSVFYRKRFHVAIKDQEKWKSRDAENLAFNIMKCVYTLELSMSWKSVVLHIIVFFNSTRDLTTNVNRNATYIFMTT